MSIEDKAQEHEAKMWEIANKPRPTQPIYSPGDSGYGPEECHKCGAEMPTLRRANGWVLCTPCQSATEARRFGR